MAMPPLSVLALGVLLGGIAAIASVVAPEIGRALRSKADDVPSLASLAAVLARRSVAVLVVTAGVTVCMAGFFARFGTVPRTVACGVFVALLACLSLIDLRTRMLPDSITLPGLWVGLLVQLHPAIATVGPERGIAGAAIGYAVPWVVGVIFVMLGRGRAIGGGDLKLLAMTGAWLGAIPALFALFIGSAGAAIVFGGGRLCRARWARRYFPFGPWLAVAAAVMVFTVPA